MSQKKRLLERKRKEEALRKAALRRKRSMIFGIVALAAVVIIIAGALLFDATRKAETVANYSAGLDSNGMVKGIKTSKYIALADLNNLNMNAEDYYPSEEEEEEYISAITDSYPELSTKKGIEVKDGDIINIDYVGSIDGVEYEGGNTNKIGIRMTLGVGDYPPEFEAGISGHKTGETFTIQVPYTTDFANEELAGKIVDYEVTINGMYVDAEFNDEFIKKNFGDTVSGTEDFLNKYRKTYAQNAFDEYVQKYIISESEVKSYPTGYLSKMKKFMKAKDLKQMETVNSTYQNLYNTNAYKDVYEMKSMSKKEYKADVKSNAETEIKRTLVMQGFYEKFGLTVTKEDVDAVVKSYGFGEDEYDKAVERFNEPYLYQQAMFNKVRDYLNENYNLPE